MPILLLELPYFTGVWEWQGKIPLFEFLKFMTFCNTF